MQKPWVYLIVSRKNLLDEACAVQAARASLRVDPKLRQLIDAIDAAEDDFFSFLCAHGRHGSDIDQYLSHTDHLAKFMDGRGKPGAMIWIGPRGYVSATGELVYEPSPSAIPVDAGLRLMAQSHQVPYLAISTLVATQPVPAAA